MLIVFSVSKSLIQSLDSDLIERISASVLCISDASTEEVIGTAVVWDYLPTDVLLLTNYHTWDDSEFRYCFPPGQKKKKRKMGEGEEDPVTLILTDKDKKFSYQFVLTSDMFYKFAAEEDFAVLKLPKAHFSMLRIPVTLGVSLTLKVHAFGYTGHTKGGFNITGGEVSAFIPEGFAMNLLSAPGFSGAAIVVDGYGRAIGYIGGNLDASKEKNSQHQLYGYRFDHVIKATGRETSPSNSPSIMCSARDNTCSVSSPLQAIAISQDHGASSIGRQRKPRAKK